MLSSSRDNWERLVTAVVKRRQIWELCHQQSRTPSICTTITSDDLSQRTLSTNLEPVSVPPSPSLPPQNLPSISKSASSRRITRKLFSAWYQRKPRDHYFDVQDEGDPVLEIHLGQLKRFSVRELQVSTDNFSNENILGKGGFGKVYKGRLADGTLVAVKRFDVKGTPDEKFQFQTEVEMINMAVHRNLLRLRGLCITPTEWLLVYPYMANGSVASCLRERSPNEPFLDWPTRARIAVESARGLSYLHDHCDPRIIHCDVNAANIYLDEEFEAVVGDFGLAKLMDYEDTHADTAVSGTIGHIAPEYISTGKISEKTDVFAYGAMLLELITAQTAFDLAHLANSDDVTPFDWVQRLLKEKKVARFVDPDLQSNYEEAGVEQLIQVALLCTQTSPLGRPKMSEVVRLFEGDHNLAKKWDEWHKVEEFRQGVGLAPYPTPDWINADSMELPSPK